MQNKDSFCAAGPVDVCALSGNTAGCPALRVWLVQLCSSMVGNVDKLVNFTAYRPNDHDIIKTILSCI